jgi:alanine racemase
VGQSVLTISTPNLIHNYRAVKHYVGDQVNVAAMLKCNAYGLGAEAVTAALLKSGCKDLYVASLAEALSLRQKASEANIYVLYGLADGQAEKFERHNLIPVLNNFHQLNLLETFARQADKKMKCCVHIDTGMTRAGVESYLAEDILNRLASSQHLTVLYVLSHLACASDTESYMNEQQLSFFAGLRKKYPQFQYSFANSAGVFLGPAYHFNQVRPGIALYGGHPLNDIRALIPVKLLPTVELHSRIVGFHFIKDSSLQCSVGYGATHKLVPGTTIAIVPVGYGDGYPISLSNKGYCCINGMRMPIVGKISMDYMCIDVSKLPEQFSRIGEQVELVGKNISIEEIAAVADTINYEVLTSLGNRYERKYLSD